MNNEIDKQIINPARLDQYEQINNKGYNYSSPKNFGIKSLPGQLNGQPDNDCVDLHAKTGIKKDNISGTLQGSDITINVENLLEKRIIKGSIKGVDFELKNDGNFLENSKFTGNIGKSPIDLKYTYLDMKSARLKGNIGDKPVNLAFKDTNDGRRIIGNFEGENINLLIKSDLKGKTIQGFCGDNKINLKIKDSGLLKNGYDIKGSFSCQPDMLPILLSSLYDMQSEELTAMMIMQMNNCTMENNN